LRCTPRPASMLAAIEQVLMGEPCCTFRAAKAARST
jgi:hypothetical protein